MIYIKFYENIFPRKSYWDAFVYVFRTDECGLSSREVEEPDSSYKLNRRANHQAIVLDQVTAILDWAT